MLEFDSLPLRIEPMNASDLGDVMEIERIVYPSPWSARAYEYELRYNEMAHYFVARAQVALAHHNSNGGGRFGWLKRMFRSAPANGNSPRLIGYVGYWLMAGEAHISTIAVHPELRGRSFGELLLAFVVQDATQRGAHVATLEVRVSNTTAQHLYLKYGFDKVGQRRAYYADNHEDAFIMTTPTLNSASYQEKFRRLTTALLMRLREALASAVARTL